ncbi:C40 family peptidase [Aliiroseovarius sp. 2305UL8-7]|uniref:C40 family peptidase n=1 Tax=Aliiroseovarius conchicola TaxID=3121637 RepID=UPI00352915C5
MDPRLTPANDHVAHESLRGVVERERYVEGETHRVAAVVADLLSPSGARNRQLLRGESFTTLEMRDGQAFGFAQKDRYCGWIDATAFIPAVNETPTHKISTARSYGKSTPGLKKQGQITALPFGAQLTFMGEQDGWAEVAWSSGTIPHNLFVPVRHLSALDHLETDPVSVAEKFLGTPYLWGGNSSFGIDCSGLVQAALLACGIPCAGDSDMQEAALGRDIPDGTPLERGDLIFWKGHVAMVVDGTRMIHANAHDMAVVYEDIKAGIARIDTQGDGPVTSRKRL